MRMIPVIGWAHAGSAESYEEIPPTWQCKLATECRDAKAFAVTLEGDSMEPRFGEGDFIIVQPSETPYSGCFVVAKFANDGVIFRRLEMSGPVISMVPLNERYQVTTHRQEDFAWIYPVWGRWTQIWKK
jgi:SOS-response transcriptional repressor LexA